MMQVLNICPKFREMKHALPTDTDTNPAIAHTVCDACLYENPGDPESTEYVVTIPVQCHCRHDFALDTHQLSSLGT
jgi:hypothetical protein